MARRGAGGPDSGFDQQLKLHIAGCPNSCGQHWIADIGLEGKKIKIDGRMVDAYYFCVGGAVGRFAAIARPIGYRCAAAEVPDAIERLLKAFDQECAAGKICGNFLRGTRMTKSALCSRGIGPSLWNAMRLPGPCRMGSKASAWLCFPCS